MLCKISENLSKTIHNASSTLSKLQTEEGFWWFTLEANEAIGAEFIMLMHFLGALDSPIQEGLKNRMLQEQREDGTWGLYFDSPGELSTTIECYFSLRLAGIPKEDPRLLKAKKFILSQGGLMKCRVFTRIHLALFGLIPWEACPSMPPALMLLPPWAPINIYNFSSWARASIVPLLVILNKRAVVSTKNIDLEELYVEEPKERKWSFSRPTAPLSLEKLFVLIDKGLKYLDKIPYKPWQNVALEKAIDWTWEHLQKTEDIYPAMAYATMAFKAFGFSNDSLQIQTTLKGLKNFQHLFVGPELPPTPLSVSIPPEHASHHQQCCISPVWDTPWSLVALLEANPEKRNDPHLLKAGEWLLSKEIHEHKGDWHFKNPEGEAGGWSFEFKNEYFPDTDDTIEVLTALHLLAIPESKKGDAMKRGLMWLLSMQNDDGGWGAFDKNNDLELVNKIPFSDHGACLDPSTPDITGRALELFLRLKMDEREKVIQKTLQYIKNTQEDFGGWYGRWGVNYIYGTWAVLTGLSQLKEKGPFQKQIEKAADWIASIQHEDGGFSESPESYALKRYVPYRKSIPSQTAWGVMALIAAGRTKDPSVQKGIQFLCDRFEKDQWSERYFTGTGFPGHFYICYHGYRHYFPLLALARYQKQVC